MSVTTPTLSIELNVTCPECEHWFDMVSDTSLNDDGWLLNKILADDEAWIDAHKRFKCSVICPECSSRFEVEGVDW